MKVTIPSGLINEKVFSKQSVFDRTRLGGKVGIKSHRFSLARDLLCFYAVAVDFLCGCFSNMNDFLLRATRHSNPCARPQPFHSAFPCCVPIQLSPYRTDSQSVRKHEQNRDGFLGGREQSEREKKNGREVKANRRYIYIH